MGRLELACYIFDQKRGIQRMSENTLTISERINQALDSLTRAERQLADRQARNMG